MTALLANFRLHLYAILLLCVDSWLLCSATLIRVEIQLGSFRFERFMLLLTFVATSTLIAPTTRETPGMIQITVSIYKIMHTILIRGGSRA